MMKTGKSSGLFSGDAVLQSSSNDIGNGGSGSITLMTGKSSGSGVSGRMLISTGESVTPKVGKYLSALVKVWQKVLGKFA